METPKCTVIIDNKIFDIPKSVEVQSSWRELTDTCTVELPKNLKYQYTENDEVKYKTIQNFSEEIKGKRIAIFTGYGTAKNLIFLGNVINVISGPPVKLECQDDMYWFKSSMPNSVSTDFIDKKSKPQKPNSNQSSNEEITNVSLNDLNKYVFGKKIYGNELGKADSSKSFNPYVARILTVTPNPNPKLPDVYKWEENIGKINIETPDTKEHDIRIGSIKFQDTTYAKVLEQLRDDYSLYSYIHYKSEIQGNTILYYPKFYIGTEYMDEKSETTEDKIPSPKCIFALYNNIIEEELEYKHKDDLKLEIVINSIAPSLKRAEGKYVTELTKKKGRNRYRI